MTIIKPRWILTEKNITVDYDSKHTIINKDHVNYKKVLLTLKSGNYTDLADLLQPAKAINLATAGAFNLVDGIVYRNGEALPEQISDKIVTYMKAELPFDSLVAFSDRVKLNPSMTTRSRLYDFLEHNGHPLTEDGHFIAYKRVRADFMDFYTGKFNHSIGSSPSMPRPDVNDDHSQTCSAGLHVCSWAYLQHYHGGEGVVIEVKVDPANVCAIPHDYQNMKMRTSGYTVLSVIAAPHLDTIVLGQVPKCVEEETGYDDAEYDEEDDEEDDTTSEPSENLKFDDQGFTQNDALIGEIFSTVAFVRPDNRVEIPSSVFENSKTGYANVTLFTNSVAIDVVMGATRGDIFLERGVRLTKSFMQANLPHKMPGDEVTIKVIARTNGDYRIVVC